MLAITISERTYNNRYCLEDQSIPHARCQRLAADRVVLATGFEPVFDHPFVEQVVSELGLERGYRGMPVLDDETLPWRTEGGEPKLYVSGAVALGTVRPYAPNLPGARRTAEHIVSGIAIAHETTETTPAAETTIQ